MPGIRWVEEGPAALPYLLNSFNSTNDKELQTLLLQIVCQSRSNEAIPFLREHLHHQVTGIWKTAIDGLVMIRSKESLQGLEATIATTTLERHEWIEEAIQQIREELHKQDAM